MINYEWFEIIVISVLSGIVGTGIVNFICYMAEKYDKDENKLQDSMKQIDKQKID